MFETGAVDTELARHGKEKWYACFAGYCFSKEGLSVAWFACEEYAFGYFSAYLGVFGGFPSLPERAASGLCADLRPCAFGEATLS